MRKALLRCGVGLISVFVLAACHGSGASKTFVNQNNTSERLTLTYSPSVYWGLFNTFSEDRTTSAGTYTLETARGTTFGTYTYARQKEKPDSYIFQPKVGKPWGVEINADGSFNDIHGNWKTTGE